MQTAAPVTAPLDRTDLAPGDPRVVAAVRSAADATGMPFEYLLAQAHQESGLDPRASNTRSSASGLFQFTASTWLDMVKRHGAKHGLENYAASITKGADGRLQVTDKHIRKAILDLRRDPKTASVMAAEYAKDNKRSLEARLGRSVSTHDLYLAHFLGAAGAAKVLEAGPKHSAASLLPQAARANPEVFNEPSGRRSVSVAALYKAVQSRYQEALGDITEAAKSGPPPIPQPRPQPEPVLQAAAVVEPPKAPEAKPAPASPFANAIEPTSPFFPVAIPPAAPTLMAAVSEKT
jgi:hypothetical protein